MMTHQITGRELLRYLAETPVDAYPAGVRDASDGSGLLLHGRPVQPADRLVCWHNVTPHREPSVGIDTDWTVDFAD